MKRSYLAQILALLGLIGTGLCCVSRVFLDYLDSGEYPLIVLACVILVAQYFLSLVFHEFGHWLFGAMVKIKAKPHIKLSGSSEVEMIPLIDKGLKGRVIFTALGGCIVNFAFVVVGAVAFAVPAVPTCLCTLAPCALYICLLNIVPAYTPNGKTDGEIVAELARGDDCAKVLLAVLTVQAQVLNGKPLSEIDKSLLFDVPVIREDDPAFIALMWLRRDFFEATGDADGVKSCEDRLENIM